jgi:hypothetical protein
MQACPTWILKKLLASERKINYVTPRRNYHFALDRYAPSYAKMQASAHVRGAPQRRARHLSDDTPHAAGAGLRIWRGFVFCR